ncbi:MAG: sensor histidine kinase [Alphaproteobacteria bacterium]|nr:sensor histidine kinase [Alphaproteobacteria bacterium]
MQKTSAFLRSFSFRAGAAIFCILSALFITQRIIIYLQTVEMAYEDIRLIIDAHEEGIDEAMEHDGVAHVKELLQGLSQNLHDKHLFLLLKEKNGALTGNLKEWPKLDFHGRDYAETTVDQPDAPDGVHLLVSVSEYPGGVKLLIGYDLERVDDLRENLFEALLENVALALIVSLATSALIIWLLARHFRRFNSACDKVMSGDLNHRIASEHSHDEFDTLAANINRMLDWNRTLIATVKDSTNAVAHDMRTPLSRLRLDLSALLERKSLDEEARQHVQWQVERVDSLIEMFENILNIAKAESRSSTELFEPIDFAQLVQDVLDFYEPIIDEKKLHLSLTLPEQLLIKADKQLLGQAVMNLVDNACKFTQSGGALSVELRKEHEQVVLTVADNGVGIAPEFLEKAKERFFRIDASRHTTGHGLGLSLVAAVAALHHGTFELADNNPGLKAIFTLRG